MKCQECGAENASGMDRCGNCGKPLPPDDTLGERLRDDRRPTKERWDESVEEESQRLDESRGDLQLASWVLIAAMLIFVIGLILQIYSNERVEGLFSNDLSEIAEAFDDLEGIAKAAKWGGYFQAFGLILLAAGLVGLTKGLSKRP